MKTSTGKQRIQNLSTTTSWLAMVATLLLSLNPQQVHGYFCGEYENALAFENEGFESIDGIKTPIDCNGKSFTISNAPVNVHWHVYFMGPGDEARYSVYPEGAFTPFFVDGGELRFQWSEEFQFSDGISAIEIFWPAWDEMTNNTIAIGGVGTVVEIESHDEDGGNPFNLFVSQEGTNQKIYLTLDATTVDFTMTGTGSTVEASVGSGSTFGMTGAKQTTKILTNGTATVNMAGVDAKVTLQANIAVASADGANNAINVNSINGCVNVTNSGSGNQCKEVTTEVAVGEPACLAPPKTQKFSCNKDAAGSSGPIKNPFGFATVMAVSMGMFLGSLVW